MPLPSRHHLQYCHNIQGYCQQNEPFAARSARGSRIYHPGCSASFCRVFLFKWQEKKGSNAAREECKECTEVHLPIHCQDISLSWPNLLPAHVSDEVQIILFGICMIYWKLRLMRLLPRFGGTARATLTERIGAVIVGLAKHGHSLYYIKQGWLWADGSKDCFRHYLVLLLNLRCMLNF
jgi:hypothetical protein